jgi:hypothetical protein
MKAIPIVLGMRDDRAVVLTPEERRHHMLVTGSSGFGKSNMFAHTMSQDLIIGNQVVSVDPHGEEYRRRLRWMAGTNLGHKKVNLFDLTADVTPGLNPLAVRSRNPDHMWTVAGQLVEAIGIVFNEKPNETPRIQLILGCCFYAAIYHGLTLVDVPRMLSVTEAKNPKRVFLRQTDNPAVNETLRELDIIRERNLPRYIEITESSRNRVFPFISNPRLYTIFSQKDNTLDIRGIMERGESLLCNTSTINWDRREEVITPENARLLGCILVNEIFRAGQARDRESRHVMVYLDEVHLYINRNVERILLESRKRNLCLHLAFQHLNQLKAFDEAIFHSVMQNTSSKLIFRMNSYEEASYLANELFTVDLKRVKHYLPHTVGYESQITLNGGMSVTAMTTKTDNWADTTGTADTRSEAWAKSRAVQRGMSLMEGSSESNGWSEGTGSSVTDTRGKAKGRSSGTGGSEGSNRGGGKGKIASRGSSTSDSLVNQEKADAYREKWDKTYYLYNILPPSEYEAFLVAGPEERRETMKAVREQLEGEERARYGLDDDERVHVEIRIKPNWNETVPRTTTGTNEGTADSENENWGTNQGTNWNTGTSSQAQRSKSHQTSKNRQKSGQIGTSRARTQNESITDTDTHTIGRAQTYSQSSMVGGAVSKGEAQGYSQGWAQVLAPILALLPAMFYSLQEMVYMFAKHLQGLRKGWGVYKPMVGDAEDIQIPLVDDFSHVKGARLNNRVRSINERQGTLLPLPSREAVEAVRAHLFSEPALTPRTLGGDGHVVDEPPGW